MSDGYIPAAGLKKLMDQIEEDLPEVEWEKEIKTYTRAIRKMVKNLIRYDVEVKDGK
jgi:Ca2+-binding EF-hand superfamily protein